MKARSYRPGVAAALVETVGGKGQMASFPFYGSAA